MSESITIRLSNSQRLGKRYTDTLQSNRRDRPHAYYKCFSYQQRIALKRRFGYDYESDSKVLKELQSTFESKLFLYHPNTRATKLGRDKYLRNEEIAFRPTMNPILSVFNKINSKYVIEDVKYAF